MKLAFINPFMHAVFNAMETMMGTTPTRSKPYAKETNVTEGDVTGLVGFASPDLTGSVALSFPEETAFQIYEKMLGTPVTEINQEVEDIVGELTNIVAGGAKNELSTLGLSYNISIPMVVSGKKHTVNHKFDKPIVVVPFKVDGNAFTMELSIKILKAKKTA